jgi:hypothetical protein
MSYRADGQHAIVRLGAFELLSKASPASAAQP